MREIYMERAIELSKLGSGNVSPNPLVGAVIVKNNKVIGEGYHKVYGGNHAEVNAIESANESINGATMYVTLEPCSHYGNTPPCAKRIVEEKIAKVVIGMVDPNPLVAGKGIDILEQAGVKVEFSSLEEECMKVNEKFLKYIKNKKPFIALKWASSLDGKIATKTKKSKWISNEESREFVQKLRNDYTGILVGINTILDDNPKLTCRLENGINPIRIVMDTNGRIPIESQVFKEAGRIIVLVSEGISKDTESRLATSKAEIIKCKTKFGKIDLHDGICKLGEKGIDSILIEGGSTINSSFINENLIDKIYCFIAPKIIGADGICAIGNLGLDEVNECKKLEIRNIKSFHNDILIEGYFKEGN